MKSVSVCTQSLIYSLKFFLGCLIPHPGRGRVHATNKDRARKPVAVSVVSESPLVADAVGHVDDVGIAELDGPSSLGSRPPVLVRQHEGLVELEKRFPEHFPFLLGRAVSSRSLYTIPYYPSERKEENEKREFTKNGSYSGVSVPEDFKMDHLHFASS